MKTGNEQITALSEQQNIRRDSAGVPTAFRVLRRGKNVYSQDGEFYELTLADAQLASILDYHALKGVAIPIDAEHFLFSVAQLLGVEETDLLAQYPMLGENSVEGFARLSEENGEVWATIEKWADGARKLLSSAGTKLAGYFSPAIRGLKSGKPRITSITLTNVPGLNDLDILAARAEPILGMNVRRLGHNNNQEEAKMKNIILRLCRVAGLDAVALTAENADLTPLAIAVEAKILQGDGIAAAGKKLMESLKDSLALSDSDTLSTATGKILSAVEKGKADALALSEATTQLKALNAAEKARTITALKAEGKLTAAMVPWAESQDILALNDWAKNAPIVVPVTQAVTTDDKPADAVALSDTLKQVALTCGMDPEKVAKTKID